VPRGHSPRSWSQRNDRGPAGILCPLGGPQSCIKIQVYSRYVNKHRGSEDYSASDFEFRCVNKILQNILNTSVFCALKNKARNSKFDFFVQIDYNPEIL
jgi:hypothetical protein